MMTRTTTKEAAEAVLRELPSVVGAFVREDIYGHPREIHLLVTPGPSPAHLARDIRTLLEERLGVPIDQRVISIAQLADEGAPTPNAAAPADIEDEASRRLQLEGVESHHDAGRVRVRVTLRDGDDFHTGEQVDVESIAGRMRAGAGAALQAVSLAAGAAGRIALESASLVDAHGRSYALVCAVAIARPLGREPLHLFGAQPLESDPVNTGAYAALKAVNRTADFLLRRRQDEAATDR